MQKEKAIKEYLQAQYRLFPVNGKIPAVKGWQNTQFNPFSSPVDFPKNFGVCLGPDDLVIDIDPGHGGKDPGAISQIGVYEKTINLTVAKKVAALLRRRAGRVRPLRRRPGLRRSLRSGRAAMPLDARPTG